MNFPHSLQKLKIVKFNLAVLNGFGDIMPKPKKWILKPLSASTQSVNSIEYALSVSPVVAKLLAVRGYDTPEKAGVFLRKENTLFHDPFLLSDMDKAVKCIVKALDKGEKITVYGDYDVDGVTSVSTLYLYLKNAGGDVDYYIPSRAGEGYGVNQEALKKLADNGTKLVITVDTGITAFEEAEYARELGMTMVVTDHHRCQDVLPNADAVVNPKRPDDQYPFKELAGVGVVFKVVSAIEFYISERKLFSDGGVGLSYRERINRLLGSGVDFLRSVTSKYIDLVAIGTVADVMTLTDENRIICALGLSLLENAPRIGAAALMDAASEDKPQKYAKKRKVSAAYIGFTIAPRVNAAGRIAEAGIGVELFTETNREKADSLARKLCALNTERQGEETRIEVEAEEMALESHDFKNDPVLVLAKEGWHHGIIGIVSSRMTEKFNLPSILISVEDGIGKGSGRSIKGLNIMEALNECKELLIRYGGHELAAGLTVSVENIDEFRCKINEYARAHINPEDNEATLEIDCEITGSDVTLGLAEELEAFEPCGVGNPAPVFMIKSAKINSATQMGGGKHTKIFVADGNSDIPALMFGVGAGECDLTAGDVVDIIFRPDVNDFQNKRSVQMIVSDIRIPNVYEIFKADCAFLRKVEAGEKFSQSEMILPDRDEFAGFYRMLRAVTEKEPKLISLYTLYKNTKSQGLDIRPAKIKLMLEILSDVGLIKFEQQEVNASSGSELYSVALVHTTGKVNLFGTPRYKSVKALEIKD